MSLPSSKLPFNLINLKKIFIITWPDQLWWKLFKVFTRTDPKGLLPLLFLTISLLKHRFPTAYSPTSVVWFVGCRYCRTEEKTSSRRVPILSRLIIVSYWWEKLNLMILFFRCSKQMEAFYSASQYQQGNGISEEKETKFFEVIMNHEKYSDITTRILLKAHGARSSP